MMREKETARLMLTMVMEVMAVTTITTFSSSLVDLSRLVSCQHDVDPRFAASKGMIGVLIMMHSRSSKYVFCVCLSKGGASVMNRTILASQESMRLVRVSMEFSISAISSAADPTWTWRASRLNIVSPY
jgi:hypothetical protein